ADIVPVVVAGVVDEGPALQRRLPLRLDAEAIGGFPDRPLDDVADPDGTLAGPVEREIDRLLRRITRAGEHLEGPLEIGFEGRGQEADAEELVEGDALEAVGGREIEDVDRLLPVGSGTRLHADDVADEPAGDRLVLRDELDLDPLAAGLVEDLAEG